MAWRDKSLCAILDFPPDLWFPTNETDPEDTETALGVCALCPALAVCAQQGAEYGIWGGRVRRVCDAAL